MEGRGLVDPRWKVRFTAGVRFYPSPSDQLGDGSACRLDLGRIRDEYAEESQTALIRVAVLSFMRFIAVLKGEAAPAAQRILDALDVRRPEAFYPDARTMKRHIIMHVGPTNSGKTHHALVALAKARRGAYLGPLRLLAHEIANRLNAGQIGGLNGVSRPCNLVTGEEMRIVDVNAGIVSSTVEMANTTSLYDVVVIDEIQLLSDVTRGAAWTKALLGVRAKELHLCGEAASVDLVKRIIERTGDSIEVRNYERLNALEVDQQSLQRDLSLIEPGDCIVAFSRRIIFDLKQELEENTNLRVACCYGGLPPEVREEQARAFNEGRADVMVASDAIGMGLNMCVCCLSGGASL